jgi:hypothetical protein
MFVMTTLTLLFCSCSMISIQPSFGLVSCNAVTLLRRGQPHPRRRLLRSTAIVTSIPSSSSSALPKHLSAIQPTTNLIGMSDRNNRLRLFASVTGNVYKCDEDDSHSPNVTLYTKEGMKVNLKNPRKCIRCTNHEQPTGQKLDR